MKKDIEITPLDSSELSQRTKLALIELIRSSESDRPFKLPNEDKLAQMVGVSRNALRDALASLEEMGFVTRQRSKGTMANLVVAQLLFLEMENPDADISLYINSPGGSVTAGMAIYDTMNYIKCDVRTVCIGMAASMGAFLLMAGQKGKRLALPNSEIMIHQPLGGASGQATDVAIRAEWLVKTKEKMTRLMSEMTGQPIERVKQDVERDYFMSADEGLSYGIIDEIYRPRSAK